MYPIQYFPAKELSPHISKLKDTLIFLGLLKKEQAKKIWRTTSFKSENKLQFLKVFAINLTFFVVSTFLSATALHAQNPDPHSISGAEITGIPSERVMLVMDISITDSLLYSEYQKQLDPLIKKHGGTYQISSSGLAFNSTTNQTALPKGGASYPNRFVILKWPSLKQLQNFTNCEEYKSLAVLREKSATTKSIIVNENHPK